MEWIGNLLGLFCIYLIYKNSPMNWIVGIANCAFYAVLFFENKLFGDLGLQILYICLSLFGIYKWQSGNTTELPISELSNTEMKKFLILLGSLCLILPIILYKTVGGFSASLDGFVTGICLSATVLMCYRKIEHWYLWIISNVLYFGLYYSKGLHVTQWFQPIFLGLSILGFVQWKKELKTS